MALAGSFLPHPSVSLNLQNGLILIYEYVSFVKMQPSYSAARASEPSLGNCSVRF